jgi:hypothetical protein
MTWDKHTIEMTDIHAMKDRIIATLKECAQRAADAGDLNGYAAFLRSAEFVLAEPLRRCYPAQDAKSQSGTDGSPVPESEQEVDVVGAPAAGIYG